MLSAAIKRQHSSVVSSVRHCLPVFDENCGTAINCVSDVSPWPWPWPWPRPILCRSRPRCYHALHLHPGLCGMEFVPLGYLFETILAVRASSAAVERVYFLSVG